jgi:uncharacterized protein YkwD
VALRITTFVATLAALCLSVGAVSAGATTTSGSTLTAANVLESQVLVELNGIRRAHGLEPLRISRPLTAAADAHSRSMGTYGFFTHESRDGSEFWRRVKRFYGPTDGGMWSVGENLLWSTTGISATKSVDLWMESPGHRKNILTARWREIGLSAVTVSDAPGVFGGHDVVIMTTDFGVRT